MTNKRDYNFYNYLHNRSNEISHLVAYNETLTDGTLYGAYNVKDASQIAIWGTNGTSNVNLEIYLAYNEDILTLSDSIFTKSLIANQPFHIMFTVPSKYIYIKILGADFDNGYLFIQGKKY